MTRAPWMKWFPSDWRGDAKVRACEPLARYVWLEMLGLMHEADPYGHLVHAGRAMDLGTLSRLISVDQVDVKRAVKQLEANRVFSRTDDGVIFSRRMLRDKERSEIAKNKGAKGGHPLLKLQGLKKRQDKPGDNQNPESQDKPHIPEAREETPLKEVSSKANGPEPSSARPASDGLLDGKPPPDARGAGEPTRPPSRVFVAFDTPQWSAWSDYRRSIGKLPANPNSKLDGKNGWYFDSEWPPNHSKHSEAA